MVVMVVCIAMMVVRVIIFVLQRSGNSLALHFKREFSCEISCAM